MKRYPVRVRHVDISHDVSSNTATTGTYDIWTYSFVRIGVRSTKLVIAKKTGPPISAMTGGANKPIEVNKQALSKPVIH